MFFLKRQLTKLATRAPRAYRKDLWVQLSESFDQEYAQVRCSHRFRFASAGLLAIVLMTTMGTGVYAYESPDVVDGHALYPMKAGIESVQSVMAKSPEARARFHAKMMSRRLSEGEHQLQGRPEAVEVFLGRAADQLQFSIQQLSQEVNNRDELIEQLSLYNARYLELSSRVVNDISVTHPLRARVEGMGLTDDEQTRLFQSLHRGRGVGNGR